MNNERCYEEPQPVLAPLPESRTPPRGSSWRRTGKPLCNADTRECWPGKGHAERYGFKLDSRKTSGLCFTCNLGKRV